MKFYNIELIIYSEDKEVNFINLLDYLKKHCNYAYILHDNDTNEDGSRKKPHYHILCFFPTQHSINAFSKALGVKENLIQIVKNKVGAIQYLIHKNDPEKAQYDINSIFTNFDISKYFDNRIDTENQIIYDLMTYIKSSDRIYLSSFYDYILKNNYWPYYRRNAFMINELIKEHNLFIDNVKYF